MNPKQLACVVLMMFIGVVTYAAQTVHQKVNVMKKAASSAKSSAIAAEGENETAKIFYEKAKIETEEIRRFLTSWTPYVDKVQTEQEVDSSIEFSLRDRGINLVRSRKSEVKSRQSKVMPKLVITTLVLEDEYAKVLNWMGDLEKRLPLARILACHFTGGSNARQLKLDVTFETPLINLAAADESTKEKKKK